MTLLSAMREKYPAYADNIAKRFEESTKESFDWQNLSRQNLSKFTDYIKSVVAQSTARHYCAIMKSVLGLYDDEHELPKNWRNLLRVKSEDSEQVFLTEKEIQKLTAYEPTSDVERYVHTSFLLGCLTGARHSDFVRFTSENIGTDGKLRYTSQKTRTSATLPVAPIVHRLLKVQESIADMRVSDTTFNNTIRNICMKCGIIENMKLYRRGRESTHAKFMFVSSHTARRSFASNLYLRGCDILSISIMMGHASVDMTRGYIFCGLRDLPDSVTSFFKQFK